MIVLYLDTYKKLPCDVCEMRGFLEAELETERLTPTIHETCPLCFGKGWYRCNEFEVSKTKILQAMGENNFRNYLESETLAEEVYKLLPL